MTRKTRQSSGLYTDAINLLPVTFILFYCLQGSSTIVPWASGAGQGLLTICWEWKYETNKRATFPLLFFVPSIANCSISRHRVQQVSESNVLSPSYHFLQETTQQIFHILFRKIWLWSYNCVSVCDTYDDNYLHFRIIIIVSHFNACNMKLVHKICFTRTSSFRSSPFSTAAENIQKTYILFL